MLSTACFFSLSPLRLSCFDGVGCVLPRRRPLSSCPWYLGLPCCRPKDIFWHFLVYSVWARQLFLPLLPAALMLLTLCRLAECKATCVRAARIPRRECLFLLHSFGRRFVCQTFRGNPGATRRARPDAGWFNISSILKKNFWSKLIHLYTLQPSCAPGGNGQIYGGFRPWAARLGMIWPTKRAR